LKKLNLAFVYKNTGTNQKKSFLFFFSWLRRKTGQKSFFFTSGCNKKADLLKIGLFANIESTRSF